ncbi:hypothetical protein [Novosphingobium sp.]|uniref:DUF6931 family protein n=1 Tax=Novosphingobium sp. TaxID=1874826 RepID=UPI0031E38ADA
MTTDTATHWPRTIWSEAGQINRLNGRRQLGDESVSPTAYFQWLLAEEHDREAALFLAQALTRYEAVAWAAQMIALTPSPTPAARSAFETAQAWLADPSEPRRRAAGEQAIAIIPPEAESLCALAAFHTGGSIAPPEQPPMPPSRGAAGRFAGAAVIAAAARAHHPADLLRQALDEGARLASRMEIAP